MIPDREECQDLADFNEGREVNRERPQIRRSFDHLAQPHRHIVVQDGRARLTHYGRGALQSLRMRGPRPNRYPLAKLHMVELGIGRGVASKVAIAKWKRDPILELRAARLNARQVPEGAMRYGALLVEAYSPEAKLP